MCSASQPCCAGEIGTDAQRETFLAQQNISAVTGADRDDGVVLREMTDETALRIHIEQRMHAAVPFRFWVVAEPFDRDRPHARHDAHAEHDINRIGDFKSDLGQRRIGRAHDVGNDEHGAAAHRAFEQIRAVSNRSLPARPIVRRTGFFLRRRANESELLDPRDVVRV